MTGFTNVTILVGVYLGWVVGLEERVIRRALISVYDKGSLLDLAASLSAWGVEIIATGNTAAFLQSNGFDVVEVSDYTGFPEVLGGRVKTLHPMVHGGILADRSRHQEDLKGHNIPPIDLVVVNLYPFKETLAVTNETEQLIEKIDIGGVALLRAAAKNFLDVCVLSDPADYHTLTASCTNLGYRRSMAAKAFVVTASYDSVISGWFAGFDDCGPRLSDECDCSQPRALEFRYGENPHQKARFYGEMPFIQIQGKELSYNNFLDVDSAVNVIREFQEPAVAIIKHCNPCGVSLAGDVREAYSRAFACDSISSFGGIIAMNRVLEATLAEDLTKVFLEVLVVPEVSEAAKEILAKKNNLRVLVWKEPNFGQPPQKEFRSVVGGIAVQDCNNVSVYEPSCVTQKRPTEDEMKDLEFAWKVCKHVRSNGIVIASGGVTVGIGVGQTSRVDSTKIALSKNPSCTGKVLASDAFFPFSDSIDLAASAGVRAIIQPGGSRRDKEVIDAAEKHGIAMIFTGIRNFRH